MKKIKLLSIFCFSFFLLSCGQTGRLYLPDQCSCHDQVKPKTVFINESKTC